MPSAFADSLDGEEKRILDSFSELFKEYGSQFGNYFKHFHLLIAYINDVKIKGFQKRYYIELVKSQLSKYEILLIAYDYIWIQDKPKGRKFIEFARDDQPLSALETDELIQSKSSIKHETLFKERYGISFEQNNEFTI